jgi:copper(I)-binding protein
MPHALVLAPSGASIRRQIMKSILLAAILAILANGASAHEYKVGSLDIKHPWSRATPKGATVAAGYLAIVNNGTTADRLVSVSSPAAGKSEIHEMSMDNGVMKMRPLPNGVEIKPGATVELKPSSDHVMFVGVKQPFEKGARVKGTLTFEKAGPVEVEFLVEAAGATPGSGQMDHGGMPMHGH